MTRSICRKVAPGYATDFSVPILDSVHVYTVDLNITIIIKFSKQYVPFYVLQVSEMSQEICYFISYLSLQYAQNLIRG